MVRYVLAAALVLGACYCLAQADYVRIQIDLNKFTKLGQSDTAGGQGAMPPGSGGPTPPGSPGFPGGGGKPPGGGFSGKPPGGGFPGGGFPGGGYPPGMTPPGGGTKAAKTPPMLVEVWLRFDPEQLEKTTDRRNGKTYLTLVHHWGKSQVPAEVMVRLTEKTLGERYQQKLKHMKEKTAGNLFEMADWLLRHGLLQDGYFHKTMGELAKKAPMHPAVDAYKQVYAQMKAQRKDIDPTAQAIIERLTTKEGYHAEESEGGHYLLLTKLDSGDKRVTDRLKVLENSYQKFYFWFALRGKVLPQPNYRLVVVLDRDATEFFEQHKTFSAGPRNGGGFLVRRDNVIFLSAEPTTRAFRKLKDNNRSNWGTYRTGKKSLLQGAQVPALFGKTDDYAKLSTTTLVQQVMEVESELSATSHEAVLQLLAVTNLLPRNVPTAEWLRYGLASFFETPPRTFFDCTALPSWTNLVSFKYLRKTDRLPDSASGAVLLNVVTDQYFNQAQLALQQVPRNTTRETLEERRANEQLEMAQATSWALTYYLMNHRLDEVFAYTAELQKLPRDAEFDAPVLAGCFARAFGMPAPGNALPINTTLAKDLATTWFNTLTDTQLDIQGLESQLLSAREAQESKREEKQEDDAPKGGNPGGGNPGGGGGA